MMELRKLKELELEEQDRRGYQAKPQRADECEPWEAISVWASVEPPDLRDTVGYKPHNPR